MSDFLKMNRIISRIESELLQTLFNYIIPFLDKKISTKKFSSRKFFLKNQSDLETIVNNDSVKKFIIKDDGFFSQVKHQKKNLICKELNFFYIRRQKNSNEKNINSSNYSISIKYEENQHEDKLNVSIKKEDKEIYFAERINKKNSKEKSNFFPDYSINISYNNNYFEERLLITYKQQLRDYMQQHAESKEDMSSRVLLKWLNILPESMMGGVLGFTYLGENFMARRADLTGSTARMVDIHESIHTPDEYETRVLTNWIMENVRGNYIK